MLVRLYEPILFRAMAAANAGVRRNALHLLLDAFPLLVSGAPCTSLFGVWFGLGFGVDVCLQSVQLVQEGWWLGSQSQQRASLVLVRIFACCRDCTSPSWSGRWRQPTPGCCTTSSSCCWMQSLDKRQDRLSWRQGPPSRTHACAYACKHALACAHTHSLSHSLTPSPNPYPLQDPEASTEEQDEMLVRQFQCLSDTLTDPCPLVRVAAAQGICTILNLYWEIIPSATTAGYVSRLTGVHVCVCIEHLRHVKQ